LREAAPDGDPHLAGRLAGGLRIDDEKDRFQLGGKNGDLKSPG
jgi:hypothetical protein